VRLSGIALFRLSTAMSGKERWIASLTCSSSKRSRLRVENYGAGIAAHADELLLGHQESPAATGDRLLEFVTGYFARRRPENCQRASGGKKLRYVARMWLAGVAQEPPRSTYWPDMNLPLYSPTAPSAGR
jgi:hypothetical protein